MGNARTEPRAEGSGVRVVPRVARLNTTIVKSTRLTHPDALEVRPEGVVGDRRLLVVRWDGSRLSGTAKAPLLGVAVTRRRGCLEFSWPDGTAIGAPPRLVGGAFEVRLFDRAVWVRRLAHPANERISADLGCAVTLAEVRGDHAGGHHALSLVSIATVEDVAHRGGCDALDPRRFRATIELDGCRPYEEDSWAGRRIRVGDVVARVIGRIPRCVLTTLDPDSGRADFPTLEVLATYRRLGTDLPLGVYADVESTAVVRVGDPVEVLVPDAARH